MFLEEVKEQLDRIENQLLSENFRQNRGEIVEDVYRNFNSVKGAASSIGFDNIAQMVNKLINVLSLIKRKAIPEDDFALTLLFEGIDILKSCHFKLGNGIEDLDEEKEMAISIDDRILLRYPQLNSDEVFNQKKETIDYIQIEDSEEKMIKQQLDIKVIEDSLEEVDFSHKLSFEEEKIVKSVPTEFNIYKIFIDMKHITQMKSIKAFLIINNIATLGDVIFSKPKDFQNLNDDDFGNSLEILFASKSGTLPLKQSLSYISELEVINIDTIRKVSDFEQRNQEEVFWQELNSLRIEVSKLDSMIEIIGELITSKEQLFNNLSRLKLKLKSSDEDVSQSIALMNNINSISKMLQEGVMSVRMISMDYIFKRFPKIVSEICQKSKKDIDFIIEGKDTQIDRVIVERLVDPLHHMIRNSIYHGIESPEERKSLKKPAKGKIKLSALYLQNYVLIELEDDGRGIDIEKIKQELLENKRFSKEEVLNMPDSKVLEYIFESGFSTVNYSDPIVKKGIGLFVAKENIRRIQGSIFVETKKNEGTKFSIILPINLSIVKALLVKEENQIFAIPNSFIIEIIRVKEFERKKYFRKQEENLIFISKNKEEFKVLNLERYFIDESGKKKDKSFIMIIRYADQKFAIMTSEIIGEREIVVKGMRDYIGEDKILGKMEGLCGVSILGDGEFANVIDVGFFNDYLDEDLNKQKLWI